MAKHAIDKQAATIHNLREFLNKPHFMQHHTNVKEDGRETQNNDQAVCDLGAGSSTPAILLSFGRSGSAVTWDTISAFTGNRNIAVEVTGGNNQKSTQFFDDLKADDTMGYDWAVQILCSIKERGMEKGNGHGDGIFGFQWKPFDKTWQHEYAIAGRDVVAKQADPPILIIYLVRNTLGRLLSAIKHKKKNITSHCEVGDEECIKSHLAYGEGVEFPTGDKLLKFLSRRERSNSSIKESLKLQKLKYIEVTYERLYESDNADEWMRIFDFIGQGPAKGLTMDEVKKKFVYTSTHTKSFQESIKNYKEVEKTLKGTEYEHLLAELSAKPYKISTKTSNEVDRTLNGTKHNNILPVVRGKLHTMEHYNDDKAMDEGTIDPSNGLPVYWINLDRSEDRRNHMQAMFKEIGNEMGRVITDVRVPAVDREELRKLLMEGRFNPGFTLVEPGEKDFGGGYWKLHQESLYAATEAATLMSHLTAVLNAYQDGHDLVLIVEDDAMISKEFMLQWESYASLAPDDWKILQWVTCNDVLLRQGVRLQDPWISWSPDHYSARAYMLNIAGMRAILDAAHSLSNDGQDIWRAPEGMLVADEVVYHLAGDAYTSTYEWIGFSDMDSTIQTGRTHQSSSRPKFDSESLAMKMHKKRTESILVITALRISSVEQMRDEFDRLRLDTTALCAFHTKCSWVVYVVLADTSVEDDEYLSAVASLPGNIQVSFEVEADTFNKFAFIDKSILKLMGSYDYVLLKDCDQRLAGMPWNTFMNRKGDAVVSGVLREARSESFLTTNRLPKRQHYWFHEASMWKKPSKTLEGWPTKMFEETESFEVPFVEQYFSLLEGDFAQWFFSNILSPSYAEQPCDWGPDMMWCGAAKQFKPSQTPCNIVPLVSLHEDTRQIETNEKWKRNCFEAIDTFYKNETFSDWISYSMQWRRIIGKSSLSEVQARCEKLLQTDAFSLDSCQTNSLPINNRYKKPDEYINTMIPLCTKDKNHEGFPSRSPVLVLSAPRSGSNLFMNMINSISLVAGRKNLDVLNLSEAFSKDKTVYDRNAKNIAEIFQRTCLNLDDESTCRHLSQEILDGRFQDPVIFLRNIIDIPTSSQNPFVAIKTFQYHIKEDLSMSLKQYIDTIISSKENYNDDVKPKHNPKFVVLWRRSMIESYVSHKIATVSGKWIFAATNETSAIVAEKKEIEKFIKYDRHWFEEVRDVLTRANIHFEVFEYERDLLSEEGKKSSIQRLASLLNYDDIKNAQVEKAISKIKATKQAQVPIEKQVKNWDKVLEWGYGVGSANAWPDIFEIKNYNHTEVDGPRSLNLPNLLMIGAQKAGSTAISKWMLEDRNNFCGYDCDHKQDKRDSCSSKEPHFIDNHHMAGPNGYARGYYHCTREPYILDATPNNLPHADRVKKIYEDASKLVGRDLLKDLKVILSIREPVSRQLSLYNHQVSQFLKTNRTNAFGSDVFRDDSIMSFEEYANHKLLLPNSPPWFSGSLYAQHLKKWFQIIPRENLLILRYDELKENPDRIQMRLTSFLGVNVTGTIKERNQHSSRLKVYLPSCRIRDKLNANLFNQHNEDLYQLLREFPNQPHKAEQQPFTPFGRMECRFESISMSTPSNTLHYHQKKKEKSWKAKEQDVDAMVLDLPSDYRICRLTDPSPQHAQPTLTGSTSLILQRLGDVPFRYQCAGHAYDHFMQHHQYPLVINRSANGYPRWGKRPSILPPPVEHPPIPSSRERPTGANRGRSVLIVGNSHTRQMAMAMLCQYGDHIVHHSPLVNGTLPGNGFTQKYILQSSNDNVLTLYIITNHAFVYSKEWKSNLEYLLDEGQTLDAMDAIIFGQFNGYDPRYTSAKMWQAFRLYAAMFPDQKIDIDRNPRGLFNLQRIAAVYQGPIVAVSSLALKSKFWYNKTMEQFHTVVEQEGRTNIRVVNSRQYYEALGKQECPSDDSTLVGTCKDSQNGHRCMGDKGGQPDMVAWDVIEALWDLFRSP